MFDILSRETGRVVAAGVPLGEALQLLVKFRGSVVGWLHGTDGRVIAYDPHDRTVNYLH